MRRVDINLLLTTTTTTVFVKQNMAKSRNLTKSCLKTRKKEKKWK